MKVVGIDFGTTNSCVAFYDGQRTCVVPNLDGSYTTPTCIYFDPSTPDVVFGSAAQQMQHHVCCFKRLIGLRFNTFLEDDVLSSLFKSRGIDVVEDAQTSLCSVKVKFNGCNRVFSVHQLTSMFLQHLVSFASDYLGRDCRIKDVVLTVPAYFDDLQRRIVMQACDAIDIRIVKMLHEPTAAAFACSPKEERPAFVLVVDCGGGTTDLSLVEVDSDELFFQVIATTGDRYLGGEDLTIHLVRHVCQRYDMANDPKTLLFLWQRCEEAKRQLTYRENTCLFIGDVAVSLSRNVFVQACQPFFGKIRRMLEEIKIGRRIDCVVLTGGTTRTPYFAVVCREVLPNIPIHYHTDADTTVATGAAMYASTVCLSGLQPSTPSMLLVDVVPMSIGIETIGGLVTPVISRNTPIPTAKHMIFSNSEDNSDFVDIAVYQGDRKFAKDNLKLATFRLSGLDRRAMRGHMKIKITISVDENGIITAEAEDITSSVGNRAKADVHLAMQAAQLYNDDERLADNELAAKVLAKTDWEYSYTRLRAISQEHDAITEELRVLFASVEHAILNFQSSTTSQLREMHKRFEAEWHRHMFSPT